MTPTVVNLRQGELYDVYIGQGSPWGNPYFAQYWTRKQKLEGYEREMRRRLFSSGGGWWKAQLADLSGKRLGCHCKPKPCHGDILVKLFLEIFGDPGKMELNEGTGQVSEGAGGEVGC